jgi:hypothetical protein
MKNGALLTLRMTRLARFRADAKTPLVMDQRVGDSTEQVKSKEVPKLAGRSAPLIRKVASSLTAARTEAK